MLEMYLTLTRLEIRIITDDRFLLPDLLGKSRFTSGDSIKLSEDVRIVFDSVEMKNGSGVQEIDGILMFSTGVGARLIANWLSDKFKRRKGTKIYVDGTEIILQTDTIVGILNEKL